MSRNRITLPVLAANSYHQASLIALVPILLDLFQVDIELMGVLVGAGLVVSGIAAPVWAAVADRHGSSVTLRSVLACAAVAVLLLCVCAVLTSLNHISPAIGFMGFILGRVVYCLSAPAILPISQAMAARQNKSGEGILGSVARLNIAGGVGRIAGNLSVLPDIILDDRIAAIKAILGA